MKVTQEHLKDIANAINTQNYVFIYSNVDPEMLTPEDLEFLKKQGINVDKLRQFGMLENAYKFGMFSARVHNTALATSYEQFLKMNTPPLTTQEKAALNFVKQRAYSDITGLGNRVIGNFDKVLIEASQQQRAELEQVIGDKAKSAVIERKNQRQLATDLADVTKNWAIDFDRIADFVLHEAFDNGRAAQIKKQYGKDAEVYKDVYDGACPICRKLYLVTGEVGTEPIVFKLTTLLANGTNIGRKAKDSKPVIGATHPYCRCTLNVKPPNSKWDEQKKQFVLVESDKEKLSKRVRERKSKGKVTIKN